jgi:hypothetical protein
MIVGAWTRLSSSWCVWVLRWAASVPPIYTAGISVSGALERWLLRDFATSPPLVTCLPINDSSVALLLISALSFDGSSSSKMTSVADTSAPSFNEFLDFFNGVTFNDENTLSEICAKEEDEPLPDPKDVKAAMYKPQKYYRRDDAGRVSFYVAWTLFVVWTDGTMRCWMKASDILRGIGYEDDKVKRTLQTFISDEKQYLP